MAFAAPGTYANRIPALNGQILIDYSRKVGDFAVNEIVHLIPVDKEIDYYAKFDPSAQSRTLDRNLRLWKDGQPRPISDSGKQSHDFVKYATERQNETLPFGNNLTAQSEWDVIKQHSNVLAVRGMTMRTIDVYTILSTSGNYLSGHTDTATNLAGGKLDVATSANNYIQKAFNGAANQIHKATHGVVGKESLTAIMSPTVAYKLAQTAEVREVYIQSQFADGMLQGNAQWSTNYGLPPKLYGINILVDPTIEVTSKPNLAGTTTKDYVDFLDEIAIVAKKGDLVATSDFATTFATIGLFVYKPEEMLLEVLDDPLNKRKLVSYTDNYDTQMIAPQTAYLITDVLT